LTQINKCLDCNKEIDRRSKRCYSCTSKLRKHSKETKNKISESHKDNKHSEETKLQMSKFRKGKDNPMYGRIGKLSPSWKGGRTIKRGYVYLRVPNHPYNNEGYVAEHRLIMEKKLGRYLKPKEEVHHENEIRDDNREENLRLFPTKGEHMTYHNNLKKEVKEW